MTQHLLTLLSIVCIVFLTSCGNETANDVTNTTKAVAKTVADKTTKQVQTGYKIGDVVKDFSLEGIDGKMFSLADLGKDTKGATIIFTCSHCPYAVMYEDRIVALSKKAKAAGYPIVAIMPNSLEIKPEDGLEGMKATAEKKGFDFPYLIDIKQEVFPQFGASRTPEVFVLNKTNKGFQLAYQGAIDDNHEEPEAVTINYVENAYKALKDGKAVSPATTKAIGCSIKVKKG